MPFCNKSSHPVLAVAVDKQQSIPAHRFVSIGGTLTENETKSLGVSEVAWLANDKAAITVYGVMPVEAEVPITAGDNVTSSSNGKAKPATGNMPINGRALDSTLAGGFVKVLLAS